MQTDMNHEPVIQTTSLEHCTASSGTAAQTFLWLSAWPPWCQRALWLCPRPLACSLQLPAGDPCRWSIAKSTSAWQPGQTIIMGTKYNKPCSSHCTNRKIIICMAHCRKIIIFKCHIHQWVLMEVISLLPLSLADFHGCLRGRRAGKKVRGRKTHLTFVNSSLSQVSGATELWLELLCRRMYAD